MGAGCGATGLCAGHYAKHVYLTDYIHQVLENLDYNVALNGTLKDSLSDDEWAIRPEVFKEFTNSHKAEGFTVAYLNWDEVGIEKPTNTQAPKN